MLTEKIPVTRPSRSLLGLISAVLLAGLDCWCLRSLFDDSSAEVMEFLIYVLPMANLWAGSAFFLATSRRRHGAFLAGFVAAGLLAMIAFAAGWFLMPVWIAETMKQVEQHLYFHFLLGGDPQRRWRPYDIGTLASYARMAVFLVLIGVIPTSLQINFALAGGWVWDRMARRSSEGNSVGNCASARL